MNGEVPDESGNNSEADRQRQLSEALLAEFDSEMKERRAKTPPSLPEVPPRPPRTTDYQHVNIRNS